MKQSDRKPAAVGLDVGTSRVVVARPSDGGFQYESELNAFVEIPYSKLTEGVLAKESIPHSVEGPHIAVHGNESSRFAELLRVEPRRPMIRGFLNPAEPEGLARIGGIVRALCGPAQNGVKLHFSVPAAPTGEKDGLLYHERSLLQVLSDLGYEAKSVNEGLAVVYSELEKSNYTGIGISCGGGLCNVCLAYLSVPVFSFSIPKAGDFIDSGAASVTGELANAVRLLKEESFRFNGHAPDKIHQALGVYYEDMIRTLLAALREQLVSCRSLARLGRQVPIVLSGGSALPRGFRERFEVILKESDLPIAVSDIRMAENPLHATARGALISAMVE